MSGDRARAAVAEAHGRFRAAWAALRGQMVMRGITVSGGEVHIRRHGGSVTNGGFTDCEIFVPGPVAFRVSRDSAFEGNSGDAIAGVTRK